MDTGDWDGIISGIVWQHKGSWYKNPVTTGPESKQKNFNSSYPDNAIMPSFGVDASYHEMVTEDARVDDEASIEEYMEDLCIEDELEEECSLN